MSDSDQIADLILGIADYVGWQPDPSHKDGGFQIWNLRKQLGRHPVGSTVSRETLLRHLSPLKKETP